MARNLTRGDIHLYRFAPPDKERPVLLLTRNSAIGHLGTVTAPITSTIRNVPSEVILDINDGMKGPCAVNLHNIVTISQERLGRRVASLNAGKLHEVCTALRFSLQCGKAALSGTSFILIASKSSPILPNFATNTK